MDEYELICLALEEVRKQAYNLQQTKDTLEWAMGRKEGQQSDECLQNLIKESGEVLRETLANLRDTVLENIAEYNNGIDNVSGVDMVLAKVPFDLIYERKKAEDFE